MDAGYAGYACSLRRGTCVACRWRAAEAAMGIWSRASCWHPPGIIGRDGGWLAGWLPRSGRPGRPHAGRRQASPRSARAFVSSRTRFDAAGWRAAAWSAAALEINKSEIRESFRRRCRSAKARCSRLVGRLVGRVCWARWRSLGQVWLAPSSPRPAPRGLVLPRPTRAEGRRPDPQSQSGPRRRGQGGRARAPSSPARPSPPFPDRCKLRTGLGSSSPAPA